MTAWSAATEQEQKLLRVAGLFIGDLDHFHASHLSQALGRQVFTRLAFGKPTHRLVVSHLTEYLPFRSLLDLVVYVPDKIAICFAVPTVPSAELTGNTTPPNTGNPLDIVRLGQRAERFLTGPHDGVNQVLLDPVCNVDSMA